MNNTRVKALITRTDNPKLGVIAGHKHPVYGRRTIKGTTLYDFVTKDGRHLSAPLGKGVIADFKPVIRAFASCG